MLNCIRTDTLRVLKKKGFIVGVLVYYFVIIAGAVASKYLGVFQEGLLSMGIEMEDLAFSATVGMALPFFVMVPGIIIYQSVFADDLRSRSAQAALGGGLTRKQLILARYLEVIKITVLVMLVAFLLTFGLGIFFEAGTSSFWELVKDFALNVFLPFACFISISMIFVYPFQSSTFGLVVYLLLEFNLDVTIASAISMLPILRDRGIDLSRYTVTGLLGIYKSAPDKNLAYLLILLGAYLVLPLILTTILFRNRELEF